MNFISEKAEIGKNVTFGNFVTVYDDVKIGDDCVIESYCEMGYSNGKEKGPLIIGDSSHIRSHSILYAGSKIGKNLVTGHRVTVRENMKIGINFQLGTLADLQGDSIIGDYVRTHTGIHISEYTKIGNYVWILPYAVFMNDPYPPCDDFTKGAEISDYAVLCPRCIISSNVKVGEGAIVGAGCVLKDDLPAGKLAVGNPSKVICDVTKIIMKGNLKRAYPWKYRFSRGYPKEIVDKWMKESKNQFIL